MKLTILIPILNEEKILKQSLGLLKEVVEQERDKVEVIISDAGSSDESISIAAKFCDENQWHLVNEKMESPSIGRTVHLGAKIAKGRYVLILPCDCVLNLDSFRSLFETLGEERYDYGAFEKKYSPTSFSLEIYAKVQNVFRTRLLKNIVWTNGIWIKKEILMKETPYTEGFLEDVILSDRLKKKYHSKILKSKIVVSSRRYSSQKRDRMLLNLWIIFLYRIGCKDIDKLKKMYSGK